MRIHAALLAVALIAAVSLAVLTGLGGRRRGDGWPLAVLSGALFPLTWFVWYVRDEERASSLDR